MEKRVLLATLLSVLVLFLWQLFIMKPHQNVPLNSQTNQQMAQTPTVRETPLSAITAENVVQTNFEPVKYDLGNVSVVFNKYGGGIREIYIKEKTSNNQFNYNLFCKEDFDSFSTIREVSSEKNIYEEIKFDSQLEHTGNNYIVKFLTKDKKIQKIYKFTDNILGSSVELSLSFPSEQKTSFLWKHYIHTDAYTKEQNSVYISQNTEFETKKTSLVKKTEKGIFITPKDIQWAGITGKYFAIIFFPPENLTSQVEIKKINKLQKLIQITPLSQQKNYNLKFYILPLSVPVLKNIGNKTFQLIDWGTFAPISKLFYETLVFFNKIFKNYGIAIIGLTIVLQILTFPLTFISLKSAAHMKKIQPQIQKIQQIYKNDPKMLNSEIMRLYQQQKVNPFSGCLPLLLQIPIFWALFTMLRNTYDLRGAEFFLWIKDLSQPDRLFIPGIPFGIPVLTLLMGTTMFLQQILSGSVSDPNQKMIAYIFPVMFIIMFINFPSGLVLYWFINNLFTITIQFFINKSLK